MTSTIAPDTDTPLGVPATVSWRQPRNPCLWLYVVLVGYGLYYTVTLVRSELGPYAPALGLSALIFACYAVPFWWFTTHIDRYSRIPVSVTIAAFVYGGFAATWTIAVNGNTALIGLYEKLVSPAFAQDWGAGLAAPIFEELGQGLRRPAAAVHRAPDHPDRLRRLHRRGLRRDRVRDHRGHAVRDQLRPGRLRHRPDRQQPAHDHPAARHRVHLAHRLRVHLRRGHHLPRRHPVAAPPRGTRTGAVRALDAAARQLGLHRGVVERQQRGHLRAVAQLHRDRADRRRVGLPPDRRRRTSRLARGDEPRGGQRHPDRGGARRAQRQPQGQTRLPPSREGPSRQATAGPSPRRGPRPGQRARPQRRQGHRAGELRTSRAGAAGDHRPGSSSSELS